MAFKLQAQTVIKSATLELTARQLEDLAEAAEPLQQVCGAFGDPSSPEPAPEVKALEPVVQFVGSVASLVSQTGTIRPKRTIKRRKKNPTGGA